MLDGGAHGQRGSALSIRGLKAKLEGTVAAEFASLSSRDKLGNEQVQLISGSDMLSADDVASKMDPTKLEAKSIQVPEGDRAQGAHDHGLFLRNSVKRHMRLPVYCNEWGRFNLWVNTRDVSHSRPIGDVYDFGSGARGGEGVSVKFRPRAEEVLSTVVYDDDLQNQQNLEKFPVGDATWLVSGAAGMVNLSHFFLFFISLLGDSPLPHGRRFETLHIWFSGGVRSDCFAELPKALFLRWRVEYKAFLDLIAENVVQVSSFDQVGTFDAYCSGDDPAKDPGQLHLVGLDKWRWGNLEEILATEARREGGTGEEERVQGIVAQARAEVETEREREGDVLGGGSTVDHGVGVVARKENVVPIGKELLASPGPAAKVLLDLAVRERGEAVCYRKAYLGQRERLAVHSWRGHDMSRVRVATFRKRVFEVFLEGKTHFLEDEISRQQNFPQNLVLKDFSDKNFYSGPASDFQPRWLIFVLQRKSSERSFAAEEFTQKMNSLQETLKDLAIVRYGAFESLTMQQQTTIAAHTNYLVGSHGAGLAWAALLRPKTSAVVEILPNQARDTTAGLCQVVNRWNTNPLSIYGGLARISTVHHFCLQTNEGHERDYEQEPVDILSSMTERFGLVRRQKVTIDVSGLERAVRASPMGTPGGGGAEEPVYPMEKYV